MTMPNEGIPEGWTDLNKVRSELTAVEDGAGVVLLDHLVDIVRKDPGAFFVGSGKENPPGALAFGVEDYVAKLLTVKGMDPRKSPAQAQTLIAALHIAVLRELTQRRAKDEVTVTSADALPGSIQTNPMPGWSNAIKITQETDAAIDATLQNNHRLRFSADEYEEGGLATQNYLRDMQLILEFQRSSAGNES